MHEKSPSGQPALTKEQVNAALAIWFGTDGTFEARMRGAIASALPAPAAASAPVGDGAKTLEPATEQQKLRDLADRIDHEELWRRPLLDRLDGKMTPKQVDRMDAGVALRRYAELLEPGRWLVFPPAGGIRFSASTLAAAAGMAQRDEERRAARAAQAGDGKP